VLRFPTDLDRERHHVGEFRLETRANERYGGLDLLSLSDLVLAESAGVQHLGDDARVTPAIHLDHGATKHP
jgi:hypothetical protein